MRQMGQMRDFNEDFGWKEKKGEERDTNPVGGPWLI